MNPKSILIIPYFQGGIYMDKLFQSIDIDIKVLIVANQSTQPQPLKYDCTLLFINKGLGYGRAINVGIAWAYEHGYRHAIICNQDAYFKAGSIEYMLNYLTSNPNQLIVPLVFEYQSDHIKPYVAKCYGSVFQNDNKKGELQVTYKLSKVGLSCFALDISSYPFGIFDPIYHMYFEDDDFLIYLQLRKKQVTLLTIAKLHHGSYELKPNYTDKAVFRLSKSIFQLIHKEISYKEAIISHVRGMVKYTAILDLREAYSFLLNILTLLKNKRVFSPVLIETRAVRIKTQTQQDMSRVKKD